MTDHDHVTIDQRLEDAIAAGCEQSRMLLTRRAMLGVSAGLFSWACLPQHAEAFDGDRRLLIVPLVGGMDGLHVAYYKDERNSLEGYRRTMYANQGDYLGGYRALGTTGFVINSKLKNFADWYDQGQATLVHAIAPPLQTRSHFDCMDNLQNGQPGLGNPTKDGWLNRFLAGLQQSQPLSRGLSSGGVPLILQGEAAVQSWKGSAFTGLGDVYANNIIATYKASSIPLFQRLGRELEIGLATNTTATATETDTAAPSPAPGMMQTGMPGMMMQPSIPNTALTASFRGTARLMKAQSGPRIAVLSLGGLDTHDGQIRLLDSSLEQLDNGLAAFRNELGESMWSRTVVVCVTEFGRTARQNLQGTDHGTGTVALLVGGNVRGGRVIADWPGIVKLNDSRDLRATLDTRALFKGILRDHLGLWKNDAFLNERVFPGSRNVVPMGGLIKTPPSLRLRLKPQVMST
jgi:uncharacterized protein (DUF1501 family)